MVNTMCCRFCHYYEKGRCYNRQTFAHEECDADATKFIEDGYLSESIRESFNWSKIRGLLSDVKIAKTKLDEIMGILEDNESSIIEAIDGSVSRALTNFDFSSDAQEGFSVLDTDEFVCNRYQ